MKAPKSRLTAQGQISVPAEVRRRLGIGPGSTIEWVEDEGGFVVRRAGALTFEDVHRIAFPDGPPSAPIDVKDAIRSHIRRRHARD